MRKIGFIAAAAIAANLVFSAVPAFADDITVVVDGNTIQTPSPAVIVNDRTLVPLRAISESMGFDISWDESTRGITISDGENLIFMWIDRDHAFKTAPVTLSGSVVMETPPAIMNDYTMVPLRAISEMFGADVDWSQDTQTVTVNFGKEIQAPQGFAESARSYEQEFTRKYDTYRDYVDGTISTVEAKILLENGGTIELSLYPEIAPITVANFVKLANEHFYDGLIFHRVIKDFMVQGGGFDTSYNQKKSDTIVGEFASNGYFNLIGHSRGVISMARAQANDSGSSQFFIMHKDSPSLDGRYAAFGVVKSGIEYVDAIAETPTEHSSIMNADDVPVEQQVIKTVIIE